MAEISFLESSVHCLLTLSSDAISGPESRTANSHILISQPIKPILELPLALVNWNSAYNASLHSAPIGWALYHYEAMGWA